MHTSLAASHKERMMYKWHLIFETSKSYPSDILSPSRPYILNLPIVTKWEPSIEILHMSENILFKQPWSVYNKLYPTFYCVAVIMQGNVLILGKHMLKHHPLKHTPFPFPHRMLESQDLQTCFQPKTQVTRLRG